MTKPFDVDKIAKQQQIISECKRFSKMVGSLGDLEKGLGEIVSLEIAANEAQARLDELRGYEETLKAEFDLKREQIRKADEELNGILSTKQSEVTRLDTEIAEKRAEIERLIRSRSEWMKSVGIST
jgi:hypothetical protein